MNRDIVESIMVMVESLSIQVIAMKGALRGPRVKMTREELEALVREVRNDPHIRETVAEQWRQLRSLLETASLQEEASKQFLQSLPISTEPN